MEMIIRADDMGYTETCNDGAFMAIKEGCVTVASVMLDTEGAVDALARLKACPWVSLDWSAKFWGKPVLEAERVPDLIDDDGYFRRDLLQLSQINSQELEMELEAEIRFCILNYGKAPFSALPSGSEAVDQVRERVCQHYGVFYDYSGSGKKIISCGEEYRKTLNFENYESYDPLGMIKEASAEEGSMQGKIPMITLQPGFLDDVVLRNTLEGPRSSISIQRLKDVQVLCSRELNDWIKEAGIRLVNLRDVFYGTQDCQNYRKMISGC
ncbi:MAG: ChbG/HpnK family deacetylase [Lachnospiraceae bacterium]|nr:ChbG/HpnK family deacetylase [Lachnospiraceae bacterium]